VQVGSVVDVINGLRTQHAFRRRRSEVRVRRPCNGPPPDGWIIGWAVLITRGSAGDRRSLRPAPWRATVVRVIQRMVAWPGLGSRRARHDPLVGRRFGVLPPGLWVIPL
jgi:hypothetical protein